MTRHSKNANARSFVTNYERSKQQALARFGQGSSSEGRVPFGFCCLTLRRAKNALASPQGWIFDKDAVVEYLVAERERLKEIAEASVKTKEDKTGTGNSESSSKKRSLEEISKRAGSFWVSPPESTSVRAPDLPKPIDVHPRCPMSGEKLRLKDLVPAKLEGDEKDVFSCAISKRPITHQQALLLKPSGMVVLESAFKQTVPDGSRCPLTGMSLGPHDIIKLQKGNSNIV
jgi:nitric oxide synthase-interacting protein